MEPALQETFDEVVAAFDDLTANTPVKYRLAYTADLEATFTPVFKHVFDVIQLACAGFNKHVPLSERKVDAMAMFARYRYKQILLRWLPFGVPADNGPMPRAFAQLPVRQQLAAVIGIVRSQLPNHNPSHEKLPALAAEWFDLYDDGYDVTNWYTANKDSHA